MATHTQLNLDDIQDAAPENGFGKLRTGKRSPFAHRHSGSHRGLTRGLASARDHSFGKVHDDYTADELAGLAAPSTTGEIYRRS